MSDALTVAFLAHTKQPEQWRGSASLEAELARLCERGRSRWPSLPLAPEQLIAHVASFPFGEEGSRIELSSLCAEDLHLACACAQGQPAALEAFDQNILSQLPKFLTRVRPTSDLVKEVGQRLREYLFSPRDGVPPKICDYSGRGPLAGWVRVVALRIAMRATPPKQERFTPTGPSLLDARPRKSSPEIAQLRDSTKSDCDACFHEALGRLRGEQRTLLRMHFVEGLSGVQLAQLFQVNRSTAMRWLQEARFELFDQTQRLMRQRLKVGEGQFQGLVDVVLEELDGSIAKALKE